MYTRTAVVGFFAVALLLVGYGGEENSDPSGALTENEPRYERQATWTLSDPDSVSPDDAVIEIGVQRLGWASGGDG